MTVAKPEGGQSAKARLQWIDSKEFYSSTMNMLKVHSLQSGFIRLHNQIYSFISWDLLPMGYPII
jgi:hypothetical protein